MNGRKGAQILHYLFFFVLFDFVLFLCENEKRKKKFEIQNKYSLNRPK